MSIYRVAQDSRGRQSLAEHSPPLHSTARVSQWLCTTKAIRAGRLAITNKTPQHHAGRHKSSALSCLQIPSTDRSPPIHCRSVLAGATGEGVLALYLAMITCPALQPGLLPNGDAELGAAPRPTPCCHLMLTCT